MTVTTKEDPKAAAFEELRDRASRTGHDEGFTSFIEALRESLRNGEPLQIPTPSVGAQDSPEAGSLDEIWQRYTAIGFAYGWTDGAYRLIELLAFLPGTYDEFVSHIRETRLRLAQQNNMLPLETPIEDFDFSVRSYNCLKREGIHNLDELIQRSEADLLEMRNLGSRAVDEIIAKLEAHGYQLAPSPAGF